MATSNNTSKKLLFFYSFNKNSVNLSLFSQQLAVNNDHKMMIEKIQLSKLNLNYFSQLTNFYKHVHSSEYKFILPVCVRLDDEIKNMNCTKRFFFFIIEFLIAII